MRGHWFAACTLSAATLLFAPAAAESLAAQTGMSDEGSFRISVGGREVGTEEFSIRQVGTGASTQISATGNVRLSLSSGPVRLTSRLRTSGVGASPVAYEVAVEGDSPRRIVGEMGDGRFSAKIVTPTGEQLREYVASSGAIVLDHGFAHHYYFLARRLHNGTVPVVIPRDNRQVMATVTDRGEEQVEVAGSTLSLYHLVVQPQGGSERHVWVDALNRVIKLEIPADDYVAVRTEIPR